MKESWYKNSEFLVLIFIIIIFFLIYIRRFFKNPHKTQYISIGNEQTIGKRKEQEDSFSTVITENGIMAVLADGMGGYSKGKMASNIAVNTFIREFSKLDSINNIKNFFINVANMTNREIIENSKGIRTGTTMAAVIICDSYLHWVSVGDSAIVLFRNGEFINLNKKHIFEATLKEQYASGKISWEEVMNNPRKKRLTSYIGHHDFKDIELSKEAVELRTGDKIILCSDGVYNSISEFEMEKIFIKNTKPYKAAEEIINIINKKNHPKQDNATIIILQKNS
ncbi:PP2C family serine/threonine-protein phosphatase [Clostridium sp. DJ247]|uniref:PP2C family protein-serine/threonine phosphatase n=1 Tax=Clostridium sp. DJ247 TaxID=2726188 RepID=UPI001624BCC1|nr:PP2C family serine/threonine-protein phosphatase [Clostridium sp. DJ247]MBC2580537.1 serine/threonine-protein phosphatase [Clostridium sp. DJ247]